MCILFYNDNQEHELKYKEKMHFILLFVLHGYVFSITFKMHGIYKQPPRILLFFAYETLCY